MGGGGEEGRWAISKKKKKLFQNNNNNNNNHAWGTMEKEKIEQVLSTVQLLAFTFKKVREQLSYCPPRKLRTT